MHRTLQKVFSGGGWVGCFGSLVFTCGPKPQLKFGPSWTKTALIMPNSCCVITDVDIIVTKDLPWLMLQFMPPGILAQRKILETHTSFSLHFFFRSWCDLHKRVCFSVRPAGCPSRLKSELWLAFQWPMRKDLKELSKKSNYWYRVKSINK